MATIIPWKLRFQAGLIPAPAWSAIWLTWIPLCMKKSWNVLVNNLNTLPEFQGNVPTTENLCVEVFDILERDFHHAEVDKVH